MKRSKMFSLAVPLVCTGLVVPPALAVEPAMKPVEEQFRLAVASDVALGEGGLLRGQVVDAQGAVVTGVPVSVWYENQQIAVTASNEQGEFAVAGVRGGVHQIAAGETHAIYRFWTSPTAPPSAQPTALVVSNQQVVRGQNGAPARTILTSPILWGGVMYGVGHAIGFNAGLDRRPASP